MKPLLRRAPPRPAGRATREGRKRQKKSKRPQKRPPPRNTSPRRLKPESQLQVGDERRNNGLVTFFLVVTARPTANAVLRAELLEEALQTFTVLWPGIRAILVCIPVSLRQMRKFLLDEGEISLSGSRL